MATYKEIKGVTIQTLDSDPVQNVGSWSSGGSLNQAKKQMGGAGLTPTASIVFGGVQGSPPSLATTESYNGTSWTEIGDMPQESQYLAGVGTSSAAIAIAGIGGPGDGPKGGYVQEWNGSAWSDNPNAYPFTGYSLAGAGTATAAIISGGDPARTDVNTFDGTSFTSSTAMNTGRRGHGSVGTTTANLVSCGETPRTANTELWNGSSWTEVSDMNDARETNGTGASNTSALAVGGYNNPGGSAASTEEWNGSAWYEINDLNTASQYKGVAGIAPAALAFGGGPGGKTITEEWNGAVWTEVNDLSLGRGQLPNTIGTVSATLAAGGTPPGAFTRNEEWNKDFVHGVWVSAASLNTARNGNRGAGTTTAGLVFGGGTPSNTAVTELYNGTSFGEMNDMNTARWSFAGNGTQTSALAASGYVGPPSTAVVESWNGTIWTETTDVNSMRYGIAGAGVDNTASIAFGGFVPPNASNKGNV